MLSLAQLFERSGKLQRLVTTGAKLAELDHLVKAAINDEDLSKHCTLAKNNGKELVMVVDSAAWATRLRYMLPDIIKNLRIHQEFSEIETVRYRVSPNLVPTPTRTTPGLSLRMDKIAISATNVKLIRNTAKLIKNSRLKQALLRLGSSESR